MSSFGLRWWMFFLCFILLSPFVLLGILTRAIIGGFEAGYAIHEEFSKWVVLPTRSEK